MPMGKSSDEQWPSLALDRWSDSCATLHLWTQIVGKIRLAHSPRINHSWQATLYVTSRGLTTSPIPHSGRTFEMQFDFISHELIIQASDGRTAALPLQPQSVAAFYGRVTEEMLRLDLP